MADVVHEEQAGGSLRERLSPVLCIGVLGAIWAAGVNPMALLNMLENAENRLLGLGIWSLVMLFGAWPMGAVAGLLASRLEVWGEGRWRDWVILGMGWTTLGHWLFHLAWSPMLLLGLASGQVQRPLLGAFVALGAWIPVIAAAAVAWRARVRLDAPPVGETAPRRSRPSTSALVGAALALGMAPPALWMVGLAMELDAQETALGAWLVLATGIAAALGVGVQALSAGRPGRSRARALEYGGAGFAGFWAAIGGWLLLMPMGAGWDRLILALIVALLLSLGFAIRGFGRGLHPSTP